MVIFNVIKNYGNKASLIQLNSSIGGDNIIPKIRIVHDANTAYLEIYYNVNTLQNIAITLSDFDKWILSDAIVDGSIPPGFSVQELTIIDKGMSINETSSHNINRNMDSYHCRTYCGRKQ